MLVTQNKSVNGFTIAQCACKARVLEQFCARAALARFWEGLAAGERAAQTRTRIG